MKDRFYMVFIEGENTPTAQYDNLKEAEKEAQRLADKFGKSMRVLKCASASLIKPDGITVKVDSFETALEFLGRDNNVCMCGIPDKHEKAMVAMYKLITIAEAWNKVDKFVPDFSNRNQYKWFPWFMYDDKSTGFMSDTPDYSASYVAASLGSRLCFSTSKRAEQFGKQFIDLWNDFLKY